MVEGRALHTRGTAHALAGADGSVDVAATRPWFAAYAVYSCGSLLHFYYEQYSLHPVDMRLICVAEAAAAVVLFAYVLL